MHADARLASKSRPTELCAGRPHLQTRCRTARRTQYGGPELGMHDRPTPTGIFSEDERLWRSDCAKQNVQSRRNITHSRRILHLVAQSGGCPVQSHFCGLFECLERRNRLSSCAVTAALAIMPAIVPATTWPSEILVEAWLPQLCSRLRFHVISFSAHARAAVIASLSAAARWHPVASATSRTWSPKQPLR